MMDLSTRLSVHLDDIPIYDIILTNSFQGLPAELMKLNTASKKLCIVTDTNVAKLYLDEIKELVKGCFSQVHTFIFPAGEEHKNLDTVRDLYETLIRLQFDRNDMLAALGGGVTGDLCGYGAATYLRGIPFIQIPTTLLSQVDSSIGGKTGVDFDSYKNMVGAFHMPKLVYTNTGTLNTLPSEQFASGMGEIIKHGLIKNKDYYHWLWEHADGILARDSDICRQMILISNEIKKDVVEHDPKEQGERALLNFGHTLGHAIEKLMDFSLLHGHCVAIGSLLAAYISAQRGKLTMEEVSQLKRMLKRFDLLAALDGLDEKKVVAATKNDKKMDSGRIKFILLNQIGEAYVDRTVSDEEMEAAFHVLAEL